MKLLLSPRFSEDSIALRDAALRKGWDVERVRSWRTEEVPDVRAIYGETLWAKVIAEQVGRSLIEPPLDWLTTVPHELTGREIRYGTPEQLWPIKFPAFIKPADDKRFTATVYASMPEIDFDQPILVSEPMHPQWEMRFWILNGKVLTASSYGAEGQSRVDRQGPFPSINRIFDFAEQCAASPRTPPAVVIDVTTTGVRNQVPVFQVIEANPCFGSGLYAADATLALEVIAAACVEKQDPGEWVNPASIV
jgi:hypothetical protein